MSRRSRRSRRIRIPARQEGEADASAHQRQLLRELGLKDEATLGQLGRLQAEVVMGQLRRRWRRRVLRRRARHAVSILLLVLAGVLAVWLSLVLLDWFFGA